MRADVHLPVQGRRSQPIAGIGATTARAIDSTRRVLIDTEVLAPIGVELESR